MTRPFPGPGGEGLPTQSPRPNWMPSDAVLAAPGAAGLVGVASLPIAAALRRHATLPAKAASYACPVFVAAALMMQPRQKRVIETPKDRLLLHPDRSESHGFRILSVAAGLVAVHRRRITGLRSWQKWVGGASLGAIFGEFGQLALHTCGDRNSTQKGRLKWETLSSQTGSLVRELIAAGRCATAACTLQKQQIGLTDDPEPLRPNQSVATLHRADAAMQQLRGNVVEINTRDGPHVTATEPGETELKPVPHTNYDWMVPRDRVIPELEEHISKLRAHRAKLSTEAQVIWQWLAEKEVEFYRTKDSDAAVGYDAERDKNKLREYCKLLANEHVALWIAVNKIDWMIADSQKRIAQHRRFSKGQYDASSQLNTSVPPSTLSFALDRLQNQANSLKQSIEGHDKLEQDMKDPKLPNMPEAVREMLKGVPKRGKEIFIRDLIEQGKEQKEESILQKAAVEEILRDGAKKATLAVKDR